MFEISLPKSVFDYTPLPALKQMRSQCKVLNVVVVITLIVNCLVVFLTMKFHYYLLLLIIYMIKIDTIILCRILSPVLDIFLASHFLKLQMSLICLVIFLHIQGFL
jgi:hypothetical protein